MGIEDLWIPLVCLALGLLVGMTGVVDQVMSWWRDR